MTQDRAEIAWLAGIFEGEGCIHIDKRNCIHVKVRMTDKDVLEKFYNLINLGTFKEATKSKSNKKDVWVWYTTKTSEVIEILEKFSPWFGERRLKKAKQAIEICKQKILDGKTHTRQRRKTDENGIQVCNNGHLLIKENIYRWNNTEYCIECRRNYKRSKEYDAVCS